MNEIKEEEIVMQYSKISIEPKYIWKTPFLLQVLFIEHKNTPKFTVNLHFLLNTYRLNN